MLIIALINAMPARAIEGKTGTEKFYGKITKVDMDRKMVSVYNKKRDTESSFLWDHSTSFINQKKPIQPGELRIGQSLIVSYVMNNDINKATRITVRPTPFKKKTASDTVQ